MIKTAVGTAIISVRTSDGKEFSFTWGQLRDVQAAIEKLRKFVDVATVDALEFTLP